MDQKRMSVFFINNFRDHKYDIYQHTKDIFKKKHIFFGYNIFEIFLIYVCVLRKRSVIKK